MICTQEHSLTEYLTLVKPYVSSQLIDTESWFHIEAIANLLPSQKNLYGSKFVTLQAVGRIRPRLSTPMSITSG